MAVSAGRKRFVLAAAAIVAVAMLYGMLRGGGPIAVGYHGSPAQPGYVTPFDVDGIPVDLTDGLGATWVSVAQFDSGSGSYTGQLARITAAGAVTYYPLPGVAYDLTVAHDAVWATSQNFTGTGVISSIFRFDPTNGQVASYPVGAGAPGLYDITTGPDGNAWFVEYSGTSYGVARVDNAGVITHFPLAGRSPNDLVTGPDNALWFAEPTYTQTGYSAKIAKLTISGATATVGPEYVLDSAFASSLVSGPDNALWFIEQGSGDDSITKLSIAGATAGVFTRHPIGPGSFTQGYAFDLAAGSDGALWFTTASGGNLGRMTAAGNVSYLCVGPGHPFWITSGPGGNVTYTTDRVERVPVTATGSPCPAPPPPSPPPAPPVPRGGGSVTPAVIADRTAAKISLSGPASQRFKGSVSVSVACNEACRATAQATVSTGGASKVFRSAKATKQLAAGKRTTLTIKFGKKAAKGIKRALRRKKLTAKVTIVSRDGAGNGSNAKRSVKLKR